jgi:homopolymeric O-antigen transport system permease protein
VTNLGKPLGPADRDAMERMSPQRIGTVTLSDDMVVTRQSPEPLVTVEPARHFRLDIRSLWESRELLHFLVWRDLKVRYKQTAIGAAWAIIQPLLSMLIFTVIFGMFVRISSEGIPYPLFAYVALVPWTYFAQALTRTSSSLVGDADLLTKVYFPRLIIPLRAVIAPLADLGLTFVVLLGLMAWFRVVPGVNILALPLFVLLAAATAFGVGLWLSVLNVRYRDVGHTVPFLTQMWLYGSPVVYPLSVVPEKWHFLYGINPLVVVIEGFRWSLVGARPPTFAIVAAGCTTVMLLLAGGLIYFKRMEWSLADVI